MARPPIFISGRDGEVAAYRGQAPDNRGAILFSRMLLKMVIQNASQGVVGLRGNPFSACNHSYRVDAHFDLRGCR
jgi:hypothetical protein